MNSAQDNADDEKSIYSTSTEEVDEDDEDEEEEESIFYHPITAPNLTFDTLQAAVQFDAEISKFDILSYLKNVDEDSFFERAIILVNKGRSFVEKKQSTSDSVLIGEQLNKFLSDTMDQGDDDETEFFKPILEEDAYLLNLDELLLLLQKIDISSEKDDKPSDVIQVTETKEQLQMRVSSLEEQLRLAKECIHKMTINQQSQASEALSEESKTLSRNTQRQKQLESDIPYFSSYSHYSIHETMLRDYVRTKSYEDAIVNSPPGLFQDKIVLDVGCGTGILSMFAAKAGAKKVYALDGSKDIAACARRIVSENGFEGVISVIHTKVEEWVYPSEEEKADLIISEWMGYALLFESMLPSVLFARDNFMKKGGLVYPNIARMYIEGASDDKLEFWNDVHGMKMQNMKDVVEQELTTEASVEIVPADKIVTDRCEFYSFDMNDVKDEELDFQTSFSLKGSGKVDKLVISFDIDFVESNVSFSTGCQSQPTHWAQATLWLDSIVAPTLESNDETLSGVIKMKRSKENERGYDFDVKWEVNIKGEERSKCDGSIKSSMIP